LESLLLLQSQREHKAKLRRRKKHCFTGVEKSKKKRVLLLDFDQIQDPCGDSRVAAATEPKAHRYS